MQPQLEYAGGLILMPNGKEWREARSLFERSFTSPAVRSYVPLLNDLRDIFMDQLEKNRLANLEEGFDIQPVIMRFTFDVIIRLVFGEDIGAQTGEEGRKIMKAWETWFSATGLLMLLNILLWPSAWKYLGGSLTERTKTGKKVIYDLIQRGIDRCRAAEKKERVSMLDNTLRHEKLPDFMKSDDEIKRQFTTLLFAGHDTVSWDSRGALDFLLSHIS